MLRPDIRFKILIIAILTILIISSVQFPTEKNRTSRVLETKERPSADSTRADKPTNLTMAYNSSHLFFYIDVGNDASVWEDNIDSLAILIDGDRDGAIKAFDTPRNQIRDFGMIAYAGWDFQPYETDRFGYIVEDSGNEDRDQDSRLGNLMIDPITNNGSYNFTFLAGERDVHRIYEVEINASHFGITLDPNTVLDIYIRVTFFNDDLGSPCTEGVLSGTSIYPDDIQWYTVDFQNPGGQDVTVTDVTGQEPHINGTVMPGEWPAQITDITERDAIPRPGDSRVTYPLNGNNIMADGTSVGKIVVQVRDPDANFSARSVMGNLTRLNRSLPTELHDDGNNGDEVAGDRNYTIEFTAPVGLPPDVYGVEIHVFDIYGNHFELMIKREYINVIDVNSPPRINESAPTLITLPEDCNDTYLDLNDFFYDLEEDNVEFRVSDGNGSWGLGYESDNFTASFIVNMSFRIRVKPNVYLANGVYETLTFKATDIIGSTINTLNFTITSVNDPPELVYFLTSLSSSEDAATYITIKAKDPDDMEDTLSLTTDFSDVLPDLNVETVTTKAEATNTYTYILNFTPKNEMVGDYMINVSISDDDKASPTSSPIVLHENFSLSIANTNDPPSFVSFVRGGKEEKEKDGVIKFDIEEDEIVEITITGHDDDFIHGKEDLTYSLSGHDPDRVNIERVNRSVARLHYSPVKDFNGDESIVVRVTDGEVSMSQTLKFHITPKNDDPVIQNWEIWREPEEDKNPTTPVIDCIVYRFYVREKTAKVPVEEWAVRDVDGDHISFAWIIYKDGVPTEWIWSNQIYNGTDINHTFSDLKKLGETGNYTVVLMIRDRKGLDFNGSFQTISTNIAVRKPDQVVTNGGELEKGYEPPYTIIIICAAFVILIIVGFVFVTSKARYTMTEKEAKAKEDEERVKIEEALYQAQSTTSEKSYFAPPTVETNLDDMNAFFGTGADAEPAMAMPGGPGDIIQGPVPAEGEAMGPSVPFGTPGPDMTGQPQMPPQAPPMQSGMQQQQPGMQQQQPGMQQQQPGMQQQQPGMQQQQPGMPPQAPPMQSGMPPQAPPMQSGMQQQQPGMPPQAPQMQPGMQQQQPGMQPQAPPMQSDMQQQQPGMQQQAPPMQPGMQQQQPGMPPQAPP